MTRIHRSGFLLLLVPATLLAQGAAPKKTSVEAWISPAFPIELTSAQKADKIAWLTYEKGLRNVWTASAPIWKPIRATRFLEDDGNDISDVNLSDNGNVAIFIRGSAPNGQGWVANPNQLPQGAERAIWAVKTDGSLPAWRVAEGSNPELSPDGRWVLYMRDGAIYRAAVTDAAGNPGVNPKEPEPFIVAWGRQSGPKWSPDGSKIAFTSDRTDHSFIAVYDVKTKKLDYVAPGVDRDGTPMWSPDGKKLAYLRRPGVPFGQQTQSGSGGVGNPAGPAAAAAANGRGGNAAGRGGQAATGAATNTGRGGRNGGGGGGGGGRGDAQGGAGAGQTPPNTANIPGLYSATLPGGHSLALVVHDFTTGTNKEVWHPKQGDRTFANPGSPRWVGHHILFSATIPQDEWSRWFSLSLDDPSKDPVLLTPNNGEIEGSSPEMITTSKDGKTLYYSSNYLDTEHRDIWMVPMSGGTPTQLTKGDGIETYPAPLASGKQVALLYADAKRPRSVGLVPVTGGDVKIITSLPKEFPIDKHVVPQDIVLKSPDGLEVHNQIFIPANLKPGEKRPAIVFVHGGPQRQMLLGYHYLHFYHIFYGINQWLADQGYIVISTNYRSGIGYGRSFRSAPNTGARGNSEYQDVLTAGKYLATRPDVDPKRIGIWGLSYGGLLTSEALARNSDLFIAGVDLAGVHLQGSSLDSAATSFKASSISEIRNWKSPVLLVHGDDDRNVNFSQTVGLVQLLRANNIYHELIVIPDDVHETLLFSRWLNIFDRMDVFLKRFLWNAEAAPAPTPGKTP